MKDGGEKFNLAKLLNSFLVQEAEKEMASTRRLNEDLVIKLVHSEEFQNDLDLIRGQLDIPKLDDSDLNYQVPDDLYVSVLEISKWYRKNIQNNKQKVLLLEDGIEQMMAIYKMPFNFKGWLEEYIFYGKPNYIPKYLTFYGTDFFNSHRLPKILRVTTQEKKFYKKEFRKILNLPKTGKIPFELKEIYQKFERYLNQTENKNTNRHSKNLSLGIKIIRKHKTAHGSDWEEKQIYKLTHADLVANIDKTDEPIKSEGYKKRVLNFRKIKQRTLKQLDFRKDKN